MKPQKTIQQIRISRFAIAFSILMTLIGCKNSGKSALAGSDTETRLQGKPWLEDIFDFLLIKSTSDKSLDFQGFCLLIIFEGRTKSHHFIKRQ